LKEILTVNEKCDNGRQAEPLIIILIGAFNMRKPMAIGVPRELF